MLAKCYRNITFGSNITKLNKIFPVIFHKSMKASFQAPKTKNPKHSDRKRKTKERIFILFIVSSLIGIKLFSLRICYATLCLRFFTPDFRQTLNAITFASVFPYFGVSLLISFELISDNYTIFWFC